MATKPRRTPRRFPGRVRKITLDYRRAAGAKKLLESISAVVSQGSLLWTVSDETRTIECLESFGNGYRLLRRIRLDKHFPRIPGEPDDEIDLEGLDVADGRLWFCGSHSRVRGKPEATGILSNRVRKRVSRRLFGAITLADDGKPLVDQSLALPFRGPGSLRAILARQTFIKQFMKLPSKENGLDIEGIAVLGERVLFGLRGPLIDGMAIVVSALLKRGFSINVASVQIHLLDLGGVGIRDLAQWNDRDVVILSGPVASADRPFRLHRWHPKKTRKTQTPAVIGEWGTAPEHPEGICRLDHRGSSGLLIVYDNGQKGHRIRGSRYIADWFPLPK